MASDKRNKLNQLISKWPRGTVAVSSYLNDQGFSHELIRTYRNSNWIEPVGRGAFILRGDKVGWPGALYALQTQLNLNVHAGGKTALEMKGLAHYVPPQMHKIFLYGTNFQKLPAWFKKSRWNEQQLIYSATKLFPDRFDTGLTQFDYSEFFIRISAPERAAMEMLHFVPDRVTFEEAVFGVEKDVGRGGDIEELPPVVAARNSADVSIYVDDDSMGRYRGLCLDVLEGVGKAEKPDDLAMTLVEHEARFPRPPGCV